MFEKIDISTNIQGHKFKTCFMNASGVHCSTVEELNEVFAKTGSVITKSATIEERAGNAEPRYIDVPLGSINSMGLPNNGFDYYLDYVEKKAPEGALIISVAGMSLEENVTMLKRIMASDFNHLTELNLSCPNLQGKPQTGYDFEQTKNTLDEVFSFFTKPLGIKLPPYFDLVHFDDMAKILNQYPLAYINVINSIGNGLYIDKDLEQVVIKPKNGFGGIGGEYVKPTALANVRAFRVRLKPEIAIIGTGGIINGEDIFEHILCGADLVQVGTQLHKEGIEIFTRLEEELKTIMHKKGYEKLSDFKGKLKSIE